MVFANAVTVDEFPDGYPNLAAFQSSDEYFAVYRRFGYLQSRLLLDKQDQLRILENELDTLDAKDSWRSTRLGLTREEFEPRQALLDKIETVFVSYCASEPFLSYSLTNAHPY